MVPILVPILIGIAILASVIGDLTSKHEPKDIDCTQISQPADLEKCQEDQK